jgi:hypothetical protein
LKVESSPGGKRPGSGKTTDFQGEQAKRRSQNLRVQRALENLTDEQVEAFVKVIYAKAMEGDAASLKLLLEHTKGRAATQAPVETDTTINLIALDVPRPGTERYKLLCGKCKLALGYKRRE